MFFSLESEWGWWLFWPRDYRDDNVMWLPRPGHEKYPASTCFSLYLKFTLGTQPLHCEEAQISSWSKFTQRPQSRRAEVPSHQPASATRHMLAQAFRWPQPSELWASSSGPKPHGAETHLHVPCPNLWATQSVSVRNYYYFNPLNCGMGVICYTIIVTKTSSFQAICDNTLEPGGHYAKWNKPDRERQILHDLTYMWNLKKWTHRSKE